MNEFPKWAEFTPASAAADLARLLVESEKAVAAIEASKPTTYETAVLAVDDATHALWRCWGGVSHMTSVMNSAAWRKVEADFQPQIVAFSLRVGQSRALYEALKSVTTSDPTRRRIVARAIQSAELAGVALSGAKKKRFNEIQSKLARLAMDFSNAVLDATRAFRFRKGGKVYTIDDAHYPETMKACADRTVRERLYRARSTRAPENTARIAEILKLRARLAKLLGFTNYAELSLATKCAPSVAAVFAMIDELDAATAAIALREESELAALASADLGAKGRLMPWDRAFYAERLRERKYAYGEEDFKRHFEFEKALKGLFRMTKFLFGVEVEEVKGRAKPQVWHQDVRFFAVKEKGATIAHFYLDPYVRRGLKNGGAWMNEFANRDDRRGEKPLAVLVLNLKEPDEKGRTYLPSRELETLFHEFGHATQQMLTRIGEANAAGINLVEWDAVEIASQFMENWCLDDRTGIRVPAALKAKVKAAKNFRAATACRRQLSFAKTDMLIHSKGVKDANAVKNRVFDHFGMPRLEDDLFLNAFTHIFAGGYSAGYYGYKWAEVMSADCFGAFEEAGLADDAAVRRTGRAYRETILGLGGSLSAYDVFVKFRGRKPTTEALLRQQGLA
ncbi:MAG: M3 family metallopeptidase [Kiritimatiellia bacterium]